MFDRYRAAAIQMTSGADKAANLAAATALVEQAVAEGAQLVVLPELFDHLGPWPERVAAAETIPGPTSTALAALAARLRIALVAGSIAERSPEAGRIYNTSLFIGPEGQTLAIYRKIHLFDINLPGRVSACESNWLLAGEQPIVTDTPWGLVAQAICYDLRFGNLWEAYAAKRAEVICLPAAFTQVTGADHWELLVRARAVENQAYVIAANQVGRHPDGSETFGHSLIVDPWGVVLARAHGGAGCIVADLDGAHIRAIRARLPALEHRRAFDGAH